MNKSLKSFVSRYKAGAKNNSVNVTGRYASLTKLASHAFGLFDRNFPIVIPIASTDHPQMKPRKEARTLITLPHMPLPQNQWLEVVKK